MNNFSFYKKIKSEVELGNLKIISIIAPARVGSTFFMNILSRSPSVHTLINQPFHLTYSFPYIAPQNREEIAYQRIWNKYQEAKQLHNQKTIVILLKCMARNLGIGQQAVRFTKLTDTVIFLIRNPFLSIDSLLKMQVMCIEDMPEASQHDFNKYALENGFIDKTDHGHHWQFLRDLVLETKNYQIITDLLIETLAFIELNKYEIDILNDYKYRLNGENENFNHVFALSWTGWENMAEIYEQYISEAINYVVVNSTILRCIPENVCYEISDRLNIIYLPDMINNWKLPKETVVDQQIMKTSWMKDCYNQAINSSCIKPPHESPISINLFPHIYQQHILNRAIPTYSTLLNDNHTIRPRNCQEIQSLLNTIVTEDGKLLRQIDSIVTELLLSPMC